MQMKEKGKGEGGTLCLWYVYLSICSASIYTDSTMLLMNQCVSCVTPTVSNTGDDKA